MDNNFPAQVNYRSDIGFIFSNYIREYDIQKANISILYSYGAIDKNTYKRLYDAPRELRQIEIGWMLRNNPDLYTILSNGIKAAKEELFRSNNLTETDILSIKNDAVFVIGKSLSITRFGLIKFVNKNTYTSYMLLGGVEVYYKKVAIARIMSDDNVNLFANTGLPFDDESIVEVKGIGDKNLELHRPFLLDFIIFIFECIEHGEYEHAVSSVKDFYQDYIELKLHIGYYREFNAQSLYRLKYESNIPDKQYRTQPYLISMMNNIQEHKECLNIAHNLNILRELSSYVNYMYLEYMKRKG